MFEGPISNNKENTKISPPLDAHGKKNIFEIFGYENIDYYVRRFYL
jgi:hypothetical protein